MSNEFQKFGSGIGQLQGKGTGSYRLVLYGMESWIHRLAHELPNAVKIGIRIAHGKMDRIALEAADKYVPEDTGKLRKSGRIFEGGGALDVGFGQIGATINNPETDATEVISSGIEYGGENAPYAEYVHDNTKAAHGAEWNAENYGIKTNHSFTFPTNKRASTSAFRNAIVKREGKSSRRPEERALWMTVAIQENIGKMQVILMDEIYKAMARVCKNPLRYGMPLNSSAVSNVRSELKGMGKL